MNNNTNKENKMGSLTRPTDTKAAINGHAANINSTLNKEASDASLDLNEQVTKAKEFAVEKFGEAVGQIKSASESYLKTGREYVEKNPVRTAAIAVGVGVIVGGYLMNKFRSK